MSNEIVALAKRIVAGESGNHRSKSEWHRVAKIMSEEQRQAGETSEQVYSRFVTSTDDGRVVFAAYKNAGGPDFQPTPKPVVVAKTGAAYEELRAKAAEMCETDRALTVHTAIAMIAADPKHRELWDKAKSENVSA